MATKKPILPRSLGRHLNFAAGRTTALCQLKLEPYGLSLPQWAILSCLWREGELTVGALSTLIGNGLPATSRIIDRMIERDLLERRKDVNDGRVMLVKTTRKGQDLDHLATFYEEINSILLEGFDEKERETAFDLLIRLEQNASKALA
jgi:DNA-binding MarR family transcriptional regulator